ncbi:riboflavin biosynthesis protein [Marivirga tractuosa]|uniref:Riboflavin biosynthesis protein n=1 Tax=Marivirga tractuosa (strain ATCC 23168 / DSM 4126 / NBRC 15989 / NCIMB 1408 / VKM B-1430 / H-43) TaxID=643867 RepID=E4TSG3_MARTH|nr:bifunctional riboflavin kinase/FAD synthetase [Marivirga tractuosa]ADR20783.1 riboflavin biosynthesis protein RibF [Marivirga tractuosa DSM 4126]BDD14766.1 riboflavin biosynthesis protein [Marivirga tractuosa]
MIVHDGYENLEGIKNAVVTIGTFDGIHLGHQEIISRIIELAKSVEGETALVTFWPHPRYVLGNNQDDLKLLTTFDEKAAILDQLGLDHIVRVHFTKEFSQWTSEQFIQRIIISALHTKRLVIGYDHRFGKDREGGFEHLKKHSNRYGFEVEEIPKQTIDDVGISSTKIRNAIEDGKVELAHDFLGRYYEINGEIVGGDKIGKTLGFATANIQVEEPYKLVPADGVYAVTAELKGQQYKAMLNIGYRPTVDGKTKKIEANIFDFNDDIYGEKIKINFIKRLREEIKFDSKAALSKQLQKDKEKAIQILNQHLKNHSK